MRKRNIQENIRMKLYLLIYGYNAFNEQSEYFAN